MHKLITRSSERVPFCSAISGNFSHFSAALIFFVTFFYQEKKVKSIYELEEFAETVRR
jgi:hypothetical protein